MERGAEFAYFVIVSWRLGRGVGVRFMQEWQNLTDMLPRDFYTGCSIIQLDCRLRAVHTRCSKIDCQCPLRFFILGVNLTDWTFCLAASQVTAAYLRRHRASRHNAQHSVSRLVRPVSVRGWKLQYLGLLKLSSFHCGSELWAWLSWELATK